MKEPLSWLQKELPKWQDAGLVTPDQAERIDAYYSNQKTADKSYGLVLILFGIIGSLLIGGGLILIVAHNWSELSRPARAVASVLPLFVSQLLAGWVLLKKDDSTAWRESVGIAWSLMIGLAIAMVAQTYHMPGSFDTFTMTWMLLTLPVLYLMRSISVLLIYLAGIVTWGFTSEGIRGHSNEFWLLLVAALPLIRHWISSQPFGGRATLSRWSLIIVLIIALMGFVSYDSEVAWLITNVFFAASLFGYGVLIERDAPSGWQKPALIASTVLLAIFAYCMTWYWFWEEIDDFSIRPGKEGPWVYISALVIVSVAYALSYAKTVMSRSPVALLWASVPLVFVIGLAVMQIEHAVLFLTWIMNAYVLAAGLITLWSGVRYASLMRVNVGMAVVASLIISRFFDEEFSILARAFVFIGLGIVFLFVNMRLARKKRGAGA